MLVESYKANCQMKPVLITNWLGLLSKFGSEVGVPTQIAIMNILNDGIL